jgi:tetratricopeptide (TPR) repeat protein
MRVGLDSRTVMAGIAGVIVTIMLGAVAGSTVGAAAGAWTALAGLVAAVAVAVVLELRGRAAEEVRAAAVLEELATDPAPMTGQERRGAAWLLRPEAEVVGFRPRRELDELLDWCVTGDGPGVRLVTGAGGSGKTRLAVQLRRELEARGWPSYWLPRGREQQTLQRVQAADRAAVLVADYAETRDGLAPMLADLAAGSGDPMVRVVLLARSAGEWWSKLVAGADYRVGEMLTAVSPVAVGPVAELGSPDEVCAAALAAFAGRIGVPVPDARLVLGGGVPVLVVHAAALLMVLDQASPVPETEPASTPEVLDGLLRHEARYWHQQAIAQALVLDPSVERLAVAVSCLLGAADETDAAGILARVPDLADSAGLRGRVARWLHDLYPASGTGTGAGEWIGSLRPDRVAEHLVTGELATRPGLLARLTAGLGQERVARALTVLARAALTDERAGGVLRDAFKAGLEDLAVPALTVAVETSPRVADLLSHALAEGPVPGSVLDQIADALPYPSFALAPVAAEVLQRLTVRAAAGSSTRAGRLTSLSNWLSDLGRREEALAAIEEAVTIRRELARARPDAFLPDLAMSLNNQSVFLSELGRREEALAAIEEAVAAYRELARTRPDAFLPDLAMSLNNQSGCLSELGRREEALAAIEEAVTIRRELARARPQVFSGKLASSLELRAGILSTLGREAEAQAAVDEAVTARSKTHQDARSD